MAVPQDPAAQGAAPQPQAGAAGSQWGFVTRHDPSFNPAIGVALDTMVEASDAAGLADRYNRFRVRQLEINASSRIDPLGWAFADFSLNDVRAEQELELEEAAFVMDRLPSNLSLKVGDFLADFGKWNTVHPHDRLFVNEPDLYRQFFGGALFVKGAELHQWLGLGDLPVRWSLGLNSGAEGDDHDFGGEEAAGTAFGRRGLDNWGGTARLTAQHDVGENGYFQWGLSGFYTPGALLFVDATLPSGRTRSDRFELRRAVGALDLTLRTMDAPSLTSELATVELWYGDGEFLDAGNAVRSDGHAGIWGFAEHRFSPRWAAGLYGSWADRADSTSGGRLLAGGETTAERGVFLTWNLSEFNRLRLQVNHVNFGIGEDKAFVFALQWSVILGSHYHPLDW